MSITQLLCVLQPMMLIVAFMVVVIVLKFFFIQLKYKKSRYGDVSGNTLMKTIFDKGNYGKFLTFVFLEKLSEDNRLLTNVYIPKGDGTTTEIDLLMLNSKGVYVFESKNYSGWIFWDEKSKNWTQALKGGMKNKFYNPILQNKGHIKVLQKEFKEINPSLFYSYIVFSERCELKKVSTSVENVTVIKRNKLYSILKKDIQKRPEVLEAQQVDAMFKILEKYSLADDTTKSKHIQVIKEKCK